MNDEYIKVTAIVNQTKTVFDGSTLSFIGGDKIAIWAFSTEETPVLLNDFILSNTAEKVNVFTGSFKKNTTQVIDADYYALYPTSNERSGITINCELPTVQVAPFDPSAAIILAHDNKIYNEEDMPSLTLSFQQILAPLRIDIINDDPAYEDDILKSIVVQSDDKICGSFSFDMSNPEILDFSKGSKELRSAFSSTQLIGTGFSTMVMIRPGTLGNLSIRVITDKRSFNFPIGSSVTIDKNYVNVASLNTNSVVPQNRKILACWGNSYTNRTGRPASPNACNFPDHLQELLGDEEWIVYNGGYNGYKLPGIITQLELWEATNDADLSILYMERNGGYTTNANLKEQYDEAISYLTNSDDYIVLGSHCRQYWSIAGTYPVVISESEIQDYRYYGRDGDPEQHVDTYEEAFIAPFAATNKYIDLFHSITTDWKNWLVRTGRYSNVEAINEATEYPGTGTGSDGAVMIDSNEDGIKDTAIDWPQSFWFANNAHERRFVHPSQYGAKAIALMIYDKMCELGYVTTPAE